MKNKRYSKMVAIFALVLAMAVSSLFALPATLGYAQGGYGYETVGVGGEPVSGLTLLSGRIDSSGVLTKDVTAKSSDKLCQLALNKDTKVLSRRGGRLSGVVIVEMEEPPAPPSDSSVIGLTYDFGPDGATFDPPASLTFTYDPALLPEGAVEGNLVLAMWDKEAGEWVNLVSIVDPVTKTITAEVSHFTAFSVIAYTRPAAFTVSALSIAPAVVDIGETVTIKVPVANTGDLTGTYEVTLKINDVVEATEDVTVAGGASQEVIFTTAKDAEGTYTVSVDGLSDTFTVRAPSVPPAPSKPAAFAASALTVSPFVVDIGETVTIKVLVANTGDLSGSYKVTLKIDNVVIATEDVALAGGASQRVTFTTAKDVEGAYTVDVNGLSGTFTVKAPPPPPPTKINWWLIGGIIAACIIIGVVVWQVVSRRRA